MGREPSEDEIVQFSAIAAVGADEARRWVKVSSRDAAERRHSPTDIFNLHQACNNDVEAALNRFFANEPLPEVRRL